MNYDLREIFIEAINCWNCPYDEVERNLFRVEIAADSDAAKICEAHGTVHIALEEFGDEVLGAFATWRSFVPGSYFIHRFLEYLRSGPVVGQSVVAATHKAPPVEAILSTGKKFAAACEIISAIRDEELGVPVLVFHFSVHIMGVEPVSEIVDVAVDLIRFNVLPDPSDRTPIRYAAGPECGESLKLDRAFEVAVERLRGEVDNLLDAYSSQRAKSTVASLQRIRAARKIDLEALARSHGDPQTIGARQVELAELWSIREQDAQARATAERVEIALVAATLQWRPMAPYIGTLSLSENRTRQIELLFDRSTGWIEPLRCESCQHPSDHLVAGVGSCTHLMCEACAQHFKHCIHVVCLSCRSKCKLCGKNACPVCSPRCAECGGYVCAEHLRTCSECKKPVCRSCRPPCTECNRTHCREHAPVCPVCEGVLCPRKKHRPNCYPTWFVIRSKEAFFEGNRLDLGVNEWLYPFTPREPECSWLQEILDGPPIEMVSLQDKGWWLIHLGISANPHVQEYGLLAPLEDDSEWGRQSEYGDTELDGAEAPDARELIEDSLELTRCVDAETADCAFETEEAVEGDYANMELDCINCGKDETLSYCDDLHIGLLRVPLDLNSASLIEALHVETEFPLIDESKREPTWMLFEEMLMRGEPIAVVAERFGIPADVLRRWCEKH